MQLIGPEAALHLVTPWPSHPGATSAAGCLLVSLLAVSYLAGLQLPGLISLMGGGMAKVLERTLIVLQYFQVCSQLQVVWPDCLPPSFKHLQCRGDAVCASWGWGSMLISVHLGVSIIQATLCSCCPARLRSAGDSLVCSCCQGAGWSLGALLLPPPAVLCGAGVSHLDDVHCTAPYCICESCGCCVLYCSTQHVTVMV